MQEHTAPPPATDDAMFGLQYPDWLVRLCVYSLETWHVHPALWFDMPIELLHDIYRYINKRDEIRALEKVYSNPDEAESLDMEDSLRISL